MSANPASNAQQALIDGLRARARAAHAARNERRLGRAAGGGGGGGGGGEAKVAAAAKLLEAQAEVRTFASK